jgi:hypothetical protein
MVKRQRKLPASDVKILFSRSAGRCAFPDCRLELCIKKTEKDNAKHMGKIAHIVAHSPNGPRADSTHEELDNYLNWILLCPTHHDIIDAQPHTYTVEIVRNYKIEHEKWVETQLDKAVSEVGFPELEIAAKAILYADNFSLNDFHIIPTQEKIKKNSLTKSSHNLIVMGLSGSHEITEYITKMAQLDSSFPDRLKTGFQKKYRELRENLSGDTLFGVMLDFAKGGCNDFKRQAAGLVILCHLFEICEVFEK